MATTSFSEAAHHPATMWISVARASAIHELLMEAGEFTFVALHNGQKKIAATGAGGVESLVRGALASVACRITRREPVGDHTLFIAEMAAGETDSRCSVRRPLLLSDLRSA
jgi:flavin reductase (DIM6/NTAB) family NADH-FMN oxidoreductase RutF